MPRIHFEDFRPGDVATYGDYPVTAEEIVAFARRYDPQPFHLDEEAGRRSVVGGLCASGWHSAAMLMRINCDAWVNDAASLGGPGIEEMRWLLPVRPGDRLGVRRRVLEARVSRSRPDVGFVTCHFEVENGRGGIALTQRNAFMIRLREPKGEAAPRAAAAASTPPELPAQGEGAIFADWFEDVEIGAAVRLGERRFDRASIVEFARRFDPQDFHLDEAAARRGPFGRLAASGWQTAAQWMACAMATRGRALGAGAAAGRTAPPAGPSVGYRDLKWLKPVYVDDVVTFDATALAKRPLRRPGWGLVTSRNRGFNQNGELVYEFTGAVLTAMRGGG